MILFLACDKLGPSVMHVSNRKDGEELHPVTIEYHDFLAQSVAVAGSFNDWCPAPLAQVRSGCWTLVFHLPPGPYDFRLFVDGHAADGFMPTQGDSIPEWSRGLRRISVRSGEI